MTEYEKLQERCWLLDRRIKELEQQRIKKEILRRRIKTAEKRIAALEPE